MNNDENVTNIPESNRYSKTNFNWFKDIILIQNLEYIDNNKINDSIRMLSMNIKGINPWNQYKMNFLKGLLIGWK